MSEISPALAKVAELQKQVDEKRAIAKAQELEQELKALERKTVSDAPPLYAYASFQMVKKDRYGNETVETQYLNLEGCHGDEESIDALRKTGKLVTGHGNMERISDIKTRARLTRIVNEAMGKGLDPRLGKAPSVMDAKVAKAQKERATNA